MFLFGNYVFVPFQMFSPDEPGGGGSGDGGNNDQGQPGALGNDDDDSEKLPAGEPGKPGLMRRSSDNPPPGDNDDPNKDHEKDPESKRPEHIPLKFWDEKAGKINDTAWAKAHGDMEKRLNQVLNGKTDPVPESADGYLKNFKMPEPERKNGDEIQKLDRVREFDATDPAVVALAESAKKNDLSQTQFDGIFQDMLYAMNGMLPEPYDEAAEIAALGGQAKAEALIETNKVWINRLLSTDTLNENEADFLLDFAGTAVGISAINKLRQETGEKPIPADPVLTKPGGRKTREELRAMRNDPRYNSENEEERAEYRKKVDQAYIDNDVT